MIYLFNNATGTVIHAFEITKALFIKLKQNKEIALSLDGATVM